MNWKLFFGQSFAKIDNLLLSSRSGFIKNHYPYRRNFAFDIKRTMPEPRVIFDVGAFVGDVTLEFHKHFPGAAIYAFEPVGRSYGSLLANTKGMNNVHCYNNAVGDVAGNIEIPIYADLTITTLKDVKYDAPPVAIEKVEVIRLDNFLKANSIDRIDILKIDVEGFEFEVLNGLGEYIDQVSCIVTEVGYQRNPEKTHFADMDRYMEEHGFKVFNIYELSPKYNDRTTLHYSNIAYVRS
jgi:FkbM family methyltransferase